MSKEKTLEERIADKIKHAEYNFETSKNDLSSVGRYWEGKLNVYNSKEFKELREKVKELEKLEKLRRW